MTITTETRPEIARAFVGAELYRIPIGLYEEMIEAESLGPQDRIELIHGVLVRKMPTNAPHSFTTFELAAILFTLVGDKWAVRSQAPVVIPDDSMPEPDVAVAVGARRDYNFVKPTAAQMALVVEVSETSLAFDLGVKLALYAAAKIPEYWVADLAKGKLHVHTLPRGGETPTYRSVTVLGTEDEVPLTLRGESFGTIRVGDFLTPLLSEGVSS